MPSFSHQHPSSIECRPSPVFEKAKSIHLRFACNEGKQQASSQLHRCGPCISCVSLLGNGMLPDGLLAIPVGSQGRTSRPFRRSRHTNFLGCRSPSGVTASALRQEACSMSGCYPPTSSSGDRMAGLLPTWRPPINWQMLQLQASNGRP